MLVTATVVAAQTKGSLTIKADLQEANSITGVVTARGNVHVDYPARQLSATAQQGFYEEKKQTITLIGNVIIIQKGHNQIQANKVTYFLSEDRIKAEPQAGQQVNGTYVISAKTQDTTVITADSQEANTTSGIVVATGNVHLDYPARQMTATSQKATYSDKARTIVMQGDVSVLQKGGNTLQAESVTYDLVQSRFLASPSNGKQVRGVYNLPEAQAKPAS